MIIMFICNECGSINETKKGEYIYSAQLCNCGNSIDISNRYPILQANDFYLTVGELHELCLKTYEENKTEVKKILSMDNIELEDDVLLKYYELHEKYCSKYPDNNPNKSIDRSDEFIDKLVSKYGISEKMAISIEVSMLMFRRNNFKKPLVVFTASTIEILFNDFFRQIVIGKLGEESGKIMLKKYELTSTHECLIICDAFINGSLIKNMDIIKKGFYDRWSTLRNERNLIVHDNSKYITMNRVNNSFRLIEEAIEVFANLKSLSYASKL